MALYYTEHNAQNTLTFAKEKQNLSLMAAE